MHEVECVVVGAGVIGLAVARALALSGRDVLILERERQVGTQTSARNSEVIHAGIHYAPGSVKADSCVAGRAQIYRYCLEHRIRHRQCGKFIVAAARDELGALEDLASNARRCGVDDLEWMDAGQACRIEPQLACAAVLHSPSTGIIDTHEFMQSLLGEAEAHGAVLAGGSAVESVEPRSSTLHVRLAGSEQAVLRCRCLVNAAGLDSVRVARRIRDFPAAHIPALFYAKGSYFSLAGPAPFGRLVYPLPEAGGLGVHMTLDLAGRARFGPDVEWVDAPDYQVAERRAGGFYPAIRRYWPGLEDGRLHAAYAGVRPKLSGPGEPAQDFRICGPKDHGVRGITHLFGIESPGLTACLDIADRVVRTLTESE